MRPTASMAPGPAHGTTGEEDAHPESRLRSGCKDGIVTKHTKHTKHTEVCLVTHFALSPSTIRQLQPPACNLVLRYHGRYVCLTGSVRLSVGRLRCKEGVSHKGGRRDRAQGVLTSPSHKGGCSRTQRQRRNGRLHRLLRHSQLLLLLGPSLPLPCTTGTLEHTQEPSTQAAQAICSAQSRLPQGRQAARGEAQACTLGIPRGLLCTVWPCRALSASCSKSFMFQVFHALIKCFILHVFHAPSAPGLSISLYKCFTLAVSLRPRHERAVHWTGSCCSSGWFL